MQCWDCSTTETLRVRSVPRAGLCHWLSAWWWVGVGVVSVCPWTPRMLLTPDMRETECGLSSVRPEGILRESVLLKVSWLA